MMKAMKDPRRLAALAAGLLAAFAMAGATASDAPPADAAGAEEGEAAPQVPFLGGFLEETRIVYPLRVGDWEAQGEHLYDDPALGASVRYQSGDHTDRWIDIYFYPVGVVPRTHLDQAAQGTQQEIESGLGRPGGYLEVDMGGLHRFQVEPEGGGEPIPARSADMRLRLEQGEFHSAMALLIDRMYYVKGRYSMGAALMDRAGMRAGLEGFISELVRGTYIGSTGQCWSPAPIDRLAPDAEEPANAAMTVDSGEGGAWLVDGRVLAREPDSDVAQGLALLAMAMEGRLYPGCVGAEPHNPDVGEGKREIRLEYRAPVEARPAGGRLLPARSGLG